MESYTQHLEEACGRHTGDPECHTHRGGGGFVEFGAATWPRHRQIVGTARNGGPFCFFPLKYPKEYMAGALRGR